jgi:hypothetical protein
MAKTPTAKKAEEITINELATQRISLHLVGRTPLIMNSMNIKAVRTLLLPEVMKRKTKAEQAQALKHDVLWEYRNSTYRNNLADAETRLMMPGPSVKGALMSAALDIPGVRKTEIGRLMWVNGFRLSLYGIPQIFMCVVRTADAAKTPDVRTRAIVPEWCASIEIDYVTPNLSAKSIVNLAHAAGITAGIGDFRQEKGKGSFGQFRLVESQEDADFRRIKLEGGREAQDEALENPLPYDEETQDWLNWYLSELPNASKGPAMKIVDLKGKAA